MATTASPALGAGGSREDGRGFEELRSHMFMKVGMLTQSSGSAYLELGTTKVAVAVHGPKPTAGRAEFSAQGTLNVSVHYAPFSGLPMPKTKGPNSLLLHLAHEVREALTAVVFLERYPKSSIDIRCMVLQKGGSDAAAVTMAASLAVINAGIECRAVLSAACLIMVGPHLLVDPTAEEEAAAERRALLVMDSSRSLVAHMSVDGVFSAAELKDAMGLALSVCAFYDEELKNSLKADADMHAAASVQQPDP